VRAGGRLEATTPREWLTLKSTCGPPCRVAPTESSHCSNSSAVVDTVPEYYNLRPWSCLEPTALCNYPLVPLSVFFGRFYCAGCSGSKNLALDSGLLVLSDGPGDYFDNMDCTWVIEAQGPITVVFTLLSTNETKDAVTITEEGGTPRKFSGQTLPRSYASNATRMTVKFSSASEVAAKSDKSFEATGADDSSDLPGFELELYALMPGSTRAPTAVPTKQGGPPASPLCAHALATNKCTHTRTRAPAHEQ
jgi:hypothetical protein